MFSRVLTPACGGECACSVCVLSRHMGEQAEDLIDKMRQDERIDWDNDWKLATLLIGGNDLCEYCNNRVGCLYNHY